MCNLNNPTVCGKALEGRGGTTYTEACKPHTNIPPWDIVFTTGGNLSCQYVIHAVCCNCNKEDKQKSEKVCRIPTVFASACFLFRLCSQSGIISIRT